MSDKKDLDQTVISGDTLKIKLDELGRLPPSLVLVFGPINQMGKQWALSKEEMYVGRDPKCHIFVEDRSVSKTHCKLILKDDTCSVEDMNSTNGTEIGGHPIEPHNPRIIGNNEHFKLGNVLFKFLEEGSIEAATHKRTYDRTQLDSLTNIYNRGAFQMKFEEAFKRAKLTETPLSLIVFDLDDFKKINDTYGHQAGDYVLRELASVINETMIRQNDFFARFGGEEFVLLLSGSPLKRAIEIAERIRITIEKYPFLYNKTPLKVTLSSGVATLELDMENHQELFEKADQASYVSKKEGKNRVSTL
jgi:two-component system, cell cycle response regulator